MTFARQSGGSALLFILAVFLFLSVDAVRADTNGGDYIIDQWQIESGLPHNAVTALLQTRDGYLWIGTSNGLVRFDGARFSTFRSLDHPGLASNRILCLYEDRQGTLWAGTEGGGLVRYHQGRFQPLSVSDGLSSDTVLCVGEDRAGTLWVGTSFGLNRSTSEQKTSFLSADGVPNMAVYAVCPPQRSQMFFATSNGLYQLRQERVVPFDAAGAERLRGSPVFCVHEDLERRLWAGGDSGLLRLHSSGAVDAIPPADLSGSAICRLIEGADGRIWFGTTAGDLYSVDAANGALESRHVRRFPGAVSALSQDHEGNLWIGTAAGLFRVKPRRLNWVPFIVDGREFEVSSVFQTALGDIQVLSVNQGLYTAEAGHLVLRKKLPLPEGVVVQTVCATGPDVLWLGTRSDGLLRYSEGTITKISERDGISDSQVSVLCADNKGGLWIGTRNGGLNYLTGERVSRFNTPWGFAGAYACALEIDAVGRLWIGTTGDGLFLLLNDQFVSYSTEEGLPAGSVGALHADQDGSLWVGTAAGLCRLKDAQVTAFPAPNRLNEEAILQLRGDADGNLWVGTSSGIYRCKKQQLNEFAEDTARILDFVEYGREDGLPAVQCLPQVQSPPARESLSRIWFATSRGLVTGESGRLRWNSVPPQVLVEAILVENEPVPVLDPVQIPPGRESLQIQFTALSLTAPGKVAFRYQLEGFDKDWSEITASRSARYPRVSPGKYRFRVVARNDDGVWNETGAAVSLIVVPFWWQTSWFRFGVAATAALTLASYYRSRKTRRREIERLRLRIASDLHDDVGSSLWSITLLSRMLSQHGTLSPEERQDVNEINRIALQTSNSIRDIIWLINPALDTLSDLVLRINDLANTMLRGTRFSFTCERIDTAQRLPADFRQNLFFLIKEALTNVARHAHASEVRVLLQQEARCWRLLIHDNGVGFDPGKATAGNGLKNLRSRAEKMGGNLQIRTQPGAGVELLLTVDRP